MIKELTRSNSKNQKGYTNKNLKEFINRDNTSNMDNSINDFTYMNRSTNNIKVVQEGMNSKKNSIPQGRFRTMEKDISYGLDKTEDTNTQQIPQPIRNRPQESLYNILRDGNEYKKLSRPASMKTMKKKMSSTMNVSISTDADKSKKRLNESLNTDRLKNNTSYMENGKLFYINFFKIVKTLEALIGEIKTKGFEKCRQEIDQKFEMKKQIEINVENLKRRLNFLNSQKKFFGTKNLKFESESVQFSQISNVYTTYNILL